MRLNRRLYSSLCVYIIIIKYHVPKCFHAFKNRYVNQRVLMKSRFFSGYILGLCMKIDYYNRVYKDLYTEYLIRKRIGSLFV